MPILDDGRHVEVLFNTLGVVNRLNSMQLYEQSLNCIGNRILERVLDESFDIDYRLGLIKKAYHIFNEKQAVAYDAFVESLDSVGLENHFKELKETGIVFVIEPMWQDKYLFEKMKDFYTDETFKFVKPYDVYVNRFGRKIKMMGQHYVGEMYIMRLQQTSEKGFSARSTGSINKLGLPDRPSNTKNDLYSKNPIRVGIQENNNAEIGVSSYHIAKMHMFHRNSQLARQETSQLLASKGHIEELDPEGYVNRNATILNVELKGLGLRLEDENEDFWSYQAPDYVASDKYDEHYIIGNEEDVERMKAEIDIEKEIREGIFIGTQEEYDNLYNSKLEEWSKNRS